MFPDRLEHPVAGAELDVSAAKETLVDQGLERVGIGATDTFGGVVAATAHEDAKAPE